MIKMFLNQKQQRDKPLVLMNIYMERIEGIQLKSRGTMARMEAFEDELVDQMDSALASFRDLVWTKAGGKIKPLKKGHFYHQVKALDR